MPLLAHSAQILFQLAVILLTAVGWGFWIARCALKRPARAAAELLLCGAGGLCACWLVLQNLAYFGVRLAWSAWFGAGIAILGVFTLWRSKRSESRFEARNASRDARSLGSVTLLVFAFQAAGLIYHGPRDYYGHATQDQVNYVQLAQFLIEKPFRTTLAEVGLQPWLIKGIETKNRRIGQSIANGYVAVITRSDAKAAYGAVSVFFVALMSASVVALVRALGVSRPLSWLAGAWAGTLPAIAQVHLDGFFSQTSALFCFPALALSLLRAARNFRLAIVATTLVLTFLLSAYSELFPIGLGMAAVLTLATKLPWTERLAFLGVMSFGPLLLLWPQAPSVLRFIAEQYRSAADPMALAEWVPHAGTWRGWSQLFIIAPSAAGGLVRAQVIGGFVMLALIGVGLMSRDRRRMFWLVALALVPVAVLVKLLSTGQLPRYPFGKLLVSFAPLAAVFATLGVARLALLLRRTVPPGRAAATCIVVFASLGISASCTKLARVVRNGAGLPTMNSDQVRAIYRELEDRPERRYLLQEPHLILNAWFCYHGRAAEIYSDVSQIGDRAINPGEFLFQRCPDDSTPTWTLTASGIQSQPHVARCNGIH